MPRRKTLTGTIHPSFEKMESLLFHYDEGHPGNIVKPGIQWRNEDRTRSGDEPLPRLVSGQINNSETKAHRTGKNTEAGQREQPASGLILATAGHRTTCAKDWSPRAIIPGLAYKLVLEAKHTDHIFAGANTSPNSLVVANELPHGCCLSRPIPADRPNRPCLSSSTREFA